jgi:hypothetical protein
MACHDTIARKAAKRERLGKAPDEEVSSEDEDNQAAWNEGTVIAGVTMYSRERYYISQIKSFHINSLCIVTC